MSDSVFFNKTDVLKEKQTNNHPWDKSIKVIYRDKLKTIHNTIHNINYPTPKAKKEDNRERIKFTVIGNRVTKEFIYCATMVRAMHQYRRKVFSSPVVRGVSSLEWQSVWHDLKIHYGTVAYCLETQVAILNNGRFFGGDKTLKEYIESRYIYYICLDYHKEAVKNFATFVNSSGRPFAYMHISIDDKEIGTLIFMLYSDLVPNTCENFLQLCRADVRGYARAPIHRIVKDGWIQCGGYSIKGSSNLDCENYIVPHDRRGVLGMCNDGRNVNCTSQFFVLLQPAPWMEYKYVAFGQLINGEETLKKIEAVPTWYESPLSRIIIFKSGILNLDCRSIHINKGAQEYLSQHEENLVSLGELLIEILMQRVWADIKARKRLKRREVESKFGEEASYFDLISVLAMNSSNKENLVPVNSRETITENKKKIKWNQENANESNKYDSSNEDFDEDTYDRRLNTCDFKSNSQVTQHSPKPKKPFYLPFTDVPYPGEKDSEFDLKRFLRGDYCLESDLEKKLLPQKPTVKNIENPQFESLLTLPNNVNEIQRPSLDDERSEDEDEVTNYTKSDAERVSFAGQIIRNIGKDSDLTKIFESSRRSELVNINEEDVKRLRHISISHRKKSMKRTERILTDEDIRRLRSPMPSLQMKTNRSSEPYDMRTRKTAFSQDLNSIKIYERSEPEMSIVDDQGERYDPLKRKTAFPQDLNSIRIYERSEPEMNTEDEQGFHFHGGRRDLITPNLFRNLYPPVSKDEKYENEAYYPRRRRTAFSQDLNSIKIYERSEPEMSIVGDQGNLNPPVSQDDKLLTEETSAWKENIEYKHRRRQTDFAKDLESVRIIDRSSTSEDTGESKKKLSVSLKISEETTDTPRKIQRRQTGLPDKEQLMKLASDEKEEEGQETVASDTPEDVTSEFRLKGFARFRSTDSLEIHQNIKPLEENTVQKHFGFNKEIEKIREIEQKLSVSLKISEETTDTPRKIQRRQTGLPDKEQLMKLASDEIEEEGQETVASDTPEDVTSEFRLKGFARFRSTDSLEIHQNTKPLEENTVQKHFGFNKEIEKIREIEQKEVLKVDSDEEAMEIRNAYRRPTPYVHMSCADLAREDSDTQIRESVAARLCKDAKTIEEDHTPPTLKNIRPISERIKENLFLPTPNKGKNSSLISDDNQLQTPVAFESREILAITKPQRQKVTSKLPDYMKKPNQFAHLRQYWTMSGLSMSKVRPHLTVEEYQQINRERRKQLQDEEKDK